MKKKTSQQNNLNGDTPATQHDLALWGGQLALQLEEKASKEDVSVLGEELALRIDEKASKEELKQALLESERRIVGEIKVLLENDKDELEGKHQDEVDIVAGNKEAPVQWKSIPRRLKVVEMDMEKIKDKLR